MTNQQNNEKTIVQKWTKEAQEVLLNKKIVGVRYLTTQEMNGLGWYSRCVVITLEDGTLIFPSRDDEGNDAGSIFYQTKKEPNGVLPVI